MQAVSTAGHTLNPQLLSDRETSERIIALKTEETRAARARAEEAARPNVGPEASRALAAVPVPVGLDAPPQVHRARMIQQWEQEAREDRIALAQKLWEASEVPPIFLDADLDLIGPDAPAQQIEVVAALRDIKDTGGMVALVGGAGRGKTHMAAGLVREFCKNHVDRGGPPLKARLTDALTIFQRITATFGRKGDSERDVIDDLASLDLLVIDEISRRGASEFEENRLFQLINTRYAHGLATVMICNLTNVALLESLPGPIVSRMLEVGSVKCCEWESYRSNRTARRAARGPRSRTNGKYQFTPVMPGAIPMPVVEAAGYLPRKMGRPALTLAGQGSR